MFCVAVLQQEEKDPQWKRAMDYLSAVSELNYMTQIVIMLYEDNNKVSFSFFIICGDVPYCLIRNIWTNNIENVLLKLLSTTLCFPSLEILCCIFSQDLSSEERFHVELHFSPGVKGVEEEENAPTGFGFRPASAEVARQVVPR